MAAVVFAFGQLLFLHVFYSQVYFDFGSNYSCGLLGGNCIGATGKREKKKGDLMDKCSSDLCHFVCL